MILIVATAVGAIFGVGIYLLLDRDLLLNATGILIISHAINVLLMAAGHLRGRLPLLPAPAEVEFSDPLAQALTLTALVITFAFTTVVLALAYRLYEADETLDQHALFIDEIDQLRDRSPPMDSEDDQQMEQPP